MGAEKIQPLPCWFWKSTGCSSKLSARATLSQGNFWSCIRMGQVVCRALLTNWFTLRSTEPSTVLGNTVKLFRLEHYLFLLLLEFCLISLHELLKKCQLFCFLSTDLPQNFRFTPHCVVHNYILLLKEKKTTEEYFKNYFHTRLSYNITMHYVQNSI